MSLWAIEKLGPHEKELFGASAILERLETKLRPPWTARYVSTFSCKSGVCSVRRNSCDRCRRRCASPVKCRSRLASMGASATLMRESEIERWIKIRVLDVMSFGQAQKLILGHLSLEHSSGLLWTRLGNKFACRHGCLAPPGEFTFQHIQPVVARSAECSNM